VPERNDSVAATKPRLALEPVGLVEVAGTAGEGIVLRVPVCLRDQKAVAGGDDRVVAEAQRELPVPD